MSILSVVMGYIVELLVRLIADYIIYPILKVKITTPTFYESYFFGTTIKLES